MGARGELRSLGSSVGAGLVDVGARHGQLREGWENFPYYSAPAGGRKGRFVNGPRDESRFLETLFDSEPGRLATGLTGLQRRRELRPWPRGIQLLGR